MTISMESVYSKFNVQFDSVSESITSVHLFINGEEVDSNYFGINSNLNENLTLNYDYIHAKIKGIQKVKIRADGQYWGLPFPLYEEEIDYSTALGSQINLIVFLKWIGPGNPPVNSKEIRAKLGSIQDNLEANSYSTKSKVFTGIFAKKFWTFSQSGAISSSMNKCAYNISCIKGGGGAEASIIIPLSGKIRFDWQINVHSSGKNGDSIHYTYKGITHKLSSQGTNKGCVREILVSAGDEFSMGVWGSSQSSSFTSKFSNLIFSANGLSNWHLRKSTRLAGTF